MKAILDQVSTGTKSVIELQKNVDISFTRSPLRALHRRGLVTIKGLMVSITDFGRDFLEGDEVGEL